jgi:small subunit ribosomal protein S17
MEKTVSKNKRILKGVVVSNKMTNTLVVELQSMKKHPKYDKRYRVSKRYHVHDTSGVYEIGDHIRFQECRPLSKTKRWFALPKNNKKDSK